MTRMYLQTNKYCGMSAPRLDALKRIVTRWLRGMMAQKRILYQIATGNLIDVSKLRTVLLAETVNARLDETQGM